MRPIINIPTPNANGIPKKYTNYKEWRRDLADAYGHHCVYCNDRLPNNFQIEHQIAQSLGIVDPLVWNNLYLACGPCNLAKSATSVTAANNYLPNAHNTHLVFDYAVRPHKTLIGKMACTPIPNPALTQSQQAKAADTIRDLKLDKVEQQPLQERKMTDVRWQNRFDAYEVTRTLRNHWDTLNTQAQRDAYLLCLPFLIDSRGFFSLWMRAFINVPEALRVITQCLPNNAQNCFDVNYLPIPRNPENLNDPI